MVYPPLARHFVEKDLEKTEAQLRPVDLQAIYRQQKILITYQQEHLQELKIIARSANLYYWWAVFSLCFGVFSVLFLILTTAMGIITISSILRLFFR